MKCSVCGEHKNVLTPAQSSLLPEIFIQRCGECEDQAKEPRYIIILASRSSAVTTDKLLPYIKGRKYCGPEITAKEILV
jgi:hypothetical protein